VSRRQLDRLEVGPYQKALLKRGLSKREEEEEESSDVRQAMEYSAAVGTMLVDDLASVNERVGNALDVQSDRIGEWWQDYQERDVRMTSLEEWKDVTMADLASLEVRLDQDELDKELMVQETEGLKVRVEGLERQLAESRQEVDVLNSERADFRARMDQMRDTIVDQEMRLMDVDNLLAERGDVFAHLQAVVQGMVPMVQELAHFRVALQHGADNPIVVMDDDEEDMGEVELEERYGPHRLVPIEELNGSDSEEVLLTGSRRDPVSN